MIRRYIATKDAGIKAEQSGFRMITSSNTGAADSIEVSFSYFPTGSFRESRMLVKFDTNQMTLDRASGKIADSGSCKFYLNLTPLESERVLMKDAVYNISPLTKEWDEGTGIDFTGNDYGYPKGLGVTWKYAYSSSLGLTEWTTEGGDYDDTMVLTSSIHNGVERVSVDVTDIVEQWIDESRDNHGLLVFVSSSYGSSPNQIYNFARATQNFASRTSEHFYYKPDIKAMWDDSKKDNRGNFIQSSSVLSSEDNLNDIYFYNMHRGELKDLSFGQNEYFVRFFTDYTGGDEIISTPSSPITGSKVSTGIYSASVALNTTSSLVYDRWYTTTSGSTPFFTGIINTVNEAGFNYEQEDQYVVKITNLKDSYYQNESPIFRVYTRNLNWTPNVYSTINPNVQVKNIDEMYYKINRLTDKLTVVDYMTGSMKSTRLSYDVSGSYFRFNMSELESDYSYEIKLAYFSNGNYKEVPKSFKFRVEKDNDR